MNFIGRNLSRYSAAEHPEIFASLTGRLPVDFRPHPSRAPPSPVSPPPYVVEKQTETRPSSIRTQPPFRFGDTPLHPKS